MPDISNRSKRCNRCGGALSSSTSGTITQWIATCNCFDPSDTADSDSSPLHILMCADCGKRINPGRSGSFTQWIFRLDLCQCENPRPMVQEHAEPQFDSLQATFLADQVDEEELQVDLSKFPVDRYRAISVIGRGGSGIVYYCRDRLLNKKVAVKTLHRLNSHQLVSFQLEARATSKFNHPNIVQILDFGVTEGGAPFMAMEYIDGINLQELAEGREPLPIDEAVWIVSKVAGALEYAHKEGVLHRDIKSSNLLLQIEEGRCTDVRLIDFGVSSARVPILEANDRDNIVGSPLYMPPDQPRGEAYDQRSEVYGLGCVLFVALTGRTPFIGQNALDTLHMHAQMPAPRLSSVRSDLTFPEPLEEIVAKTLAKNKEDRFQSMQELELALSNLLPESKREVQQEEIRPHHLHQLGSVTSIAGKVLLLPAIIFALVLTMTALQKTNKFGQTKTPKNTEEGLKVTRLAEVIDEATEAHFLEVILPSGRKELRSRGEVSDSTVKTVIGRKDIATMWLDGTHITDKSLKYLKGMPLEILRFHSCPITDSGAERLLDIPTLVDVSIMQTKVTDEGLKTVCSLPKLTRLEFGGDSLTEKSLQIVSRNKRLVGLRIEKGDTIVGRGLSPLAALPRLSGLEIVSTTAGEKLIGSLQSLQHLDVLTFRRATLQDAEMKLLAKLRISKLVFDRCNLPGQIMGYLSNIASLKKLHLIETRFDESELPRLNKLKYLTSLKITSQTMKNNHLTYITCLKKLKNLDLHDCPRLKVKYVKKLKKELPQCKIEFPSEDLVPMEDALLGVTEQIYEHGHIKLLP